MEGMKFILYVSIFEIDTAACMARFTFRLDSNVTGMGCPRKRCVILRSWFTFLIGCHRTTELKAADTYSSMVRAMIHFNENI